MSIKAGKGETVRHNVLRRKFHACVCVSESKENGTMNTRVRHSLTVLALHTNFVWHVLLTCHNAGQIFEYLCLVSAFLYLVIILEVQYLN